MAKKKAKTSKELAHSVGEFLKGKKKNKNNGELFDAAIKNVATKE